MKAKPLPHPVRKQLDDLANALVKHERRIRMLERLIADLMREKQK